MIDLKKIQEDIDALLMTKNDLGKEYFDLREKYRIEEEVIFILKDLSIQLEETKLNSIIERNTIYEINGEKEINYTFGDVDVDPNGEDEPYLHYLTWRKRRLYEAITIHSKVIKELENKVKKDLSLSNNQNRKKSDSVNKNVKDAPNKIKKELAPLREEINQTRIIDFDVLKRKEVLKMLGISAPTLSRYVKNGIITQSKIVGKVYFSRKEIEKVILKNSSSK